MTRKLIVFLVLVLGTYPLLAQNKTVSGTVTDAADGSPLPGVNVLVQGTTNGTQTDFDGNYTIEVAEGNVLVFSYIGMRTQSITVGASNTVDVQMVIDENQLDEVVVTALGLKRQKKSLTYATQNVEIDAIDEARPEQNLVNSLQGKVAGLSIQRAGTGVSGSSKVVLRGNRSFAGSSQVLYIVDGVPLGGDISNLSPDDIASISVLKGANAAAIYGARANNGAIIVTTKSGVSGRTTVDYAATVTTELANVLFDFQNEYGQGSGGNYIASSVNSWGPRFDSASEQVNWSPSPDINQPIPYSPQSDNVNDFFQTGISITNTLSITSGGEKTRTFFNYTHDDRKGIVPGNELSRHNVSVKVDNSFLDDKLQLSSRINYIRSDIDNELRTGENFANPLRHAYRLPRSIRTQDAEVFEYIEEGTGALRQNYWKPLDNGGANPYWTINRNLREREVNRVIGYASLTYNILPNLSLLVRTAVDQQSSADIATFANDTYIIAQNGDYEKGYNRYTEWNTDFLLSYNKEINEDFAFNISLGGNDRQNTTERTNTDNRGLNAPNIFTIANAQQLLVTEDFTDLNVQSLYTLGQVSYKDALFLDLTYRSDWSSTLPLDNNRFDYYSAGVSAAISDLVTLPSFISFLKVRGSYAEVGNDTDPYAIQRNAAIEAGGFIDTDDTLPNENLRPEQTRSLEAGFDLRLLDNRLGIDFTYYKTNSVDQLFRQNVPFASGVSNRFVNGGDVENRGVEVILTANPVRTADFNWNITANFTRNVGEVIALNDDLETLDFGGDFIRRFRLDVGDTWGNVYSRGWERDDQGRALVDDNGLPITTGGATVIIGNFNPDWLGGIGNSFSYKNIDFSFLIDIRQGGSLVSFTDANLSGDGALAKTAIGRENGVVFGQDVFSGLTAVRASDGAPNDIAVDPEVFWNSIGGRNAPIGEAFAQDASNVRMREMTLGYTFNKKLLDKTFLRRAKISLVGRNLFFFSNKANVDPEIVTTATRNPSTANNEEASTDGFESFAQPSSRTIGFNLQLGF
ncbi:SusC/RagA family TonB-linked outer membrane protein [Ulvibacterium sp.]|uniref:SusC/RagA family TonB-linked outer membrane protein n=1 Tax=Ulvibacterium sp. TaxID=2665914 RepID=UPI003BA8E65A